MKTQWNSEVDEHLRPDPPERLCTLYHENSKLSPELSRRLAAGLSMNRFEQYIASRGFRQHPHFSQVPLPEAAASDARLADVLRSRRSRRELSGQLTLAELSTILQQGLGPTLVFESEEGVTQAYRAWPSAGGLYPIDAYIIARSVEGLEPAIYHYNVSTVALERLPTRDERGPVDVLRDGFFWQEWVTSAAAAIVLVASFERTLAKYGERGYRLVLLDAGHAAQNALLVAEQAAVSACAVAGFCDDAVAEDLYLDGVDEAPVHAIILGKPE